jgi:uncharacterized membrane protein YphA (DoxX/SURF4 family)
MRWIIGGLTILRVGLGVLFVVSAFTKIQHPDLFIDAVQNYHILPHGLGNLFGTVLPWVELFIGACLVLGIFSTFAAAISIPVILSFIIANVYSFIHSVGEACGCLGSLINMNHTTALVVDIGMVVVAGLLLYQRGRAGMVGVGCLLRYAWDGVFE